MPAVSPYAYSAMLHGCEPRRRAPYSRPGNREVLAPGTIIGTIGASWWCRILIVRTAERGV